MYPPKSAFYKNNIFCQWLSTHSLKSCKSGGCGYIAFLFYNCFYYTSFCVFVNTMLRKH